MNDLRWTNRLLLGILILLAAHLYLKMETAVQADTLRLDDCITERLAEIPRQYLHVVAHSPP